MAAFGSLAAITALPAYAGVVTTSSYSIGTLSGAVTNVAVSPTTVAAGTAAASFQVTFTATAALAAGNSITIGISPALGTAPTSVALIDDTASTCLTSSAGFVSSTTSLVVTIPSGCSFAVGDKAEVDFKATAPGAGTETYTVTTSNNATSGTATQTITATPPTLSFASMVLGYNGTSTMTGLTFVGAATDLLVSVTGAGYNLNTGGTFTVLYGAAGTTPTTADTATVLSSPTPSPSSVTLGLATVIPAGDVINLTAPETNPTAVNTTVTESVQPESAPGTTTDVAKTNTNTVTFNTAATGVTVSASPSLAGASSTYVVSFKATSAISSGGTITITEPNTSFSGVTGALLTDTTSATHSIPTFNTATAHTIVLTIGQAVGAGDSVSVELGGVTNPSTAGTVSDLTVATSGDLATATAASYAITTSVNNGITVTVSPATPGALATYTIANIQVASGGIAAAGTITLTAPAGTVLPNNASSYQITDSTTKTGTGTVSASPTNYVGNAVTIAVPNALNASDIISITINDVYNPSTSSTSDTISLNGNVQSLGVAAPAFPTAGAAYPNGAIVNFGGTYYVFAGGKAFGCPTPAVLEGVQVVDHAVVQTAPTGAVIPTAAIRIGTLLTVPGSALIQVVGTDGDLHGFATPTQLLQSGYDGADVITVPNWGGLTVSTTTVGAAGSGQNGLATTADGVVVNSSGTFYVFAGGKAFGIPTPAALTAVLVGNPYSTPLSGSISSSATSTPIASGVVVTIGGGVYVSSGGNLFAFKSMAQLTADGYSGTPSIILPNAGGLTLIISYSGS